MEALVPVLDPDVVVRADEAAGAGGVAREVRGARNWASQAIAYSKGARFVQPALVDGALGLVLAPRGKLLRALRFTIAHGKIAGIEIVGNAERLAGMRLAALSD